MTTIQPTVTKNTKAMVTNFDGVKQYPFSRLHDGPINTVKEAMQAADLDWKVEQKDLWDADGKALPGMFAVVRSDNNKVLGFVGDRYAPIDNEQAFGILTPAIEDGSLTIGRAGFFQGGSRIFMQADVTDKGKVEIVKGDEVHSRILISTSHDGSSLLIAKSNPTRITCMNTLSTVIKGSTAGGVIKIRHTINKAQEAEAAGEIIAMALRHHAESCEAFKAFAKKKMTGAEAKEFFINVLGGRKSKDQAGKAGETEKEFRAVAQMMMLAQTSPVKAKEGTVWGFYNAATEWIDHKRTATESSIIQGAFLDGLHAAIKERAFSLAVASL